MPTPEQVARLLEAGHSYETAARELGLPAGLTFMIATGVPADAGGAPEPPDRPPVPGGSSQRLVNAREFNPTRDPRVDEWVRRRARRELGGAARRMRP